MAMNRDFVLRLLTEKRDLLKRIIGETSSNEFSLPSVIANTPLEAMIMEKANLRRRFIPAKSLYFDFENPFNRFFLLTDKERCNLEKLICCVVSTNIVKNEVRKQYVLSFIDILGESGYRFALERGSLYLPSELREHIISFFENKTECLQKAGTLVIETLLDRADEECSRHYNYFRKTLPVSLSDNELEQIYKCTIKVLSLEIDRKWQNIFS
jgi:hypothetical protein